MANGFLLDSESPQQQQLAAQQPMPAQGQGGGFNLLDVLKGLGNIVAETGAYYAASQGRPQLLQQMQAQKQQEQLQQQFQSLTPQDIEGPFGQVLQRQLQFGDMEGAQKTLINIPKYKQAQEVFKNPKLGLEPSELESLQILSSVDPEGALKLSQRMLELSQVTKRGREDRQARLEKEERAEAKKAARRPGPIVAKALQEGTVTADDPASILGLLTAEGVPIPLNESEARLLVSRIMQAPEIKKLIPKKEEKEFFDRLFSTFSGKKAPAAAAPAPAATAPVAPTPAAKTAPGTRKRFNPMTGELE